MGRSEKVLNRGKFTLLYVLNISVSLKMYIKQENKIINSKLVQFTSVDGKVLRLGIKWLINMQSNF